MSRKSPGREGKLLPQSPLLLTESAEEYDALIRALEDEIKPRGIIEQMYVADIGYIVWEILRLRRCKVTIINSGFRRALMNVLPSVMKLPRDQFGRYFDAQVEEQAELWFLNRQARKQIADDLSRFHLDESAIESEAIRINSAELELLDRMLTSLESRRNKALGCITEYRESLAHRLRDSANRLLEADSVVLLEDAANKKSAA